MQIFPISAFTDIVSSALNVVTANISPILGVFGFIVGVSLLLALLDVAGFIGQGAEDKATFKRYSGRF